MMNKNGDSKPPGVVPYLRREVFSFSLLSILLAEGFFVFVFVYAFYLVEGMLLLAETFYFFMCFQCVHNCVL